MNNIILLIITIFFTSLGQVLIKYGTLDSPNMIETLGDKLIYYFTNVYILFGLFVYIISAVLWIFVLSKLPLSIAYPMVSLGYVVVFIFSIFLFNEAINIYKVMGLLFIIMGVIILSQGAKS
jgi:multidrug transporter EmrE-like cation transporter